MRRLCVSQSCRVCVDMRLHCLTSTCGLVPTVRKGYEEETRAHNQTRALLEAAEHKISIAAQEKAAFQLQMGHLKLVIASQAKTQVDSDAKMAKMQLQLDELQARAKKLESTVAYQAVALAELEEDRISGYVASLASRSALEHASKLSDLLGLACVEYQSALAGQPLSAGTAARLEQLEDACTFQQRELHAVHPQQQGSMSVSSLRPAHTEPPAPPVQQDPVVAAESTDRVSPGRRRNRADGTRSGGVPSPSVVGREASPVVSLAPHMAKHAALLKELEVLNAYDRFPVWAARPLHPLAEALAWHGEQFRGRLRRQPMSAELLVAEALRLEASYLARLAWLDEVYHMPLLEKDDVLAAASAGEIFSNIPAIRAYHSAMLDALRESHAEPLALVTLYAGRIKELLDLYDAFVESLSNALLQFELAQRFSPGFADFLRGQSSTGVGALDLKLALCEPIHLLRCYSELFSLGSDLSGSEQLADMASVCQIVCGALHVELYMDATERACAVVALKTIEGRIGAFADSFVEICTDKRLHYEQGVFAALHWSSAEEDGDRPTLYKELLVVLCNDAVIFAEPRHGGAAQPLCLVELIPLGRLQIGQQQAESSRCIRVSHALAPWIALNLHATSSTEARRWEELLRGEKSAACLCFGVGGGGGGRNMKGGGGRA
jgi:hypothetical protein